MGTTSHLGRALPRVGGRRTHSEQQGKPGPKIPKAVPQPAHSRALWTAPLATFSVSLSSAPPSDLEPRVLQTFRKTPEAPPPPSSHSRKSPSLGASLVRRTRPRTGFWTMQFPCVQGLLWTSPSQPAGPDEPSLAEELLKNTSKQSQQSLYV